MADEIQFKAPNGPNGERFELNLKQRALSLSMKDLVPFLLLALVGALGYYRIQTHDTRLAMIDDHLQRLYTQQDAQRGELQRALLGQFDQQREQLRTQSELITSQSEQIRAGLRENREMTGQTLHDQNERLNQQTLTLNERLSTLEKYIEIWFTEVGKRLEILNHNTLHPDRALPLRSPLPPEDRPSERGR